MGGGGEVWAGEAAKSAPDSGGGRAEPCPPPVCLPPSFWPEQQGRRHGHVGAGPPTWVWVGAEMEGAVCP